MFQIKMAKLIIKLMFLYFIIYNSYFGWNRFPVNEAEKICDDIFRFGLYFSIGVYLQPVLKYIEAKIKKFEL